MKKVVALSAVAASLLLLAGAGWLALRTPPAGQREDPTRSNPEAGVPPHLAGRAVAEVDAGKSHGVPTRDPSTDEAPVRGVVVDTKRRPIPGARIELWEEERQEEPEPDAVTEADAEGLFLFDATRAGARYRVRAWTEGRTREEKRALGGGRPLVLTLWRGGSIVGRVLDVEDGKPVANAKVYVQPLDFRHDTAPRFECATRTDDSGAYELRGVLVGAIGLHVQPSAHVPASLPVAVQAGETLAKDIYVSRGARIEGRILLDGHPVADVPVRASGTGLPGRKPRTVSDADGRYRLEGLVPALWNLRVHDARFGYAGATVHLPPGADSATQDLALRGLVTVRGRVLLEGVPVAGARVRTQPRAPNANRATTDEAGRFELTTIRWTRGTKTFRAQLEESGYGAIKVPHDQADRSWDVELTRYGRVTGRVRAEDGSSLEEIRIDLQGPQPFWALTRKLEADGAYTVFAAPGPIRLRAQATAWPLTPEVHVVVKSGKTVADVDIVFPTGGTVRGRVLDDAGAPVARVYVDLDHGRSQPYPLRVITDEGGRYAMHGLQGPLVNVSVAAPYRFEGVLKRDVRLGSGDVDLVLPRLRLVIRGRVVGPDGRPCRSCDVVACMTKDGEGAAKTFAYRLDPIRVSNAEGRFTIGPLRPHQTGRMQVLARTRGAVSNVVEVAASADAAPEIVLRLEPASWLRGTVRDKRGEPLAKIPILHSAMVTAGSQLRSDADGHFVVGPVPTGSHEVTLRPWGYVQHTIRQVAEAGRDAEIEIVLYAGGDVRLLVRDEEGRPLAGAKAEFLDADGRVIPIDRRTNPNNRKPHVPREGQTTSNDEGLVHRQWLPPGPGRARVTREGYADAEVPVEVVDESVVETAVLMSTRR